jgi:hypothetical protein
MKTDFLLVLGVSKAILFCFVLSVALALKFVARSSDFLMMIILKRWLMTPEE